MHDYQTKYPKKKVAPFAVNLVALDSNKRFLDDLETIIEHKVPIVITSMRAPEHITRKIHAYGGLHFHDVINLKHAKKAIKSGVDGLVLVCAGAGGHAGMLNPFAFIKDIKQIFNGYIALAGCITSGNEIAAAEILGADFVYVGTRFIASSEAIVDKGYKQLLVESNANDIVMTPTFTGVNANFLTKSIQNAGIKLSSLAGPLVKKPNKLILWWKHLRIRKLKKWKDIWSAGQGVSGINEISTVEEIVNQMQTDYKAVRLRK